MTQYFYYYYTHLCHMMSYTWAKLSIYAQLVWCGTAIQTTIRTWTRPGGASSRPTPEARRRPSRVGPPCKMMPWPRSFLRATVAGWQLTTAQQTPEKATRGKLTLAIATAWLLTKVIPLLYRLLCLHRHSQRSFSSVKPLLILIQICIIIIVHK